MSELAVAHARNEFERASAIEDEALRIYLELQPTQSVGILNLAHSIWKTAADERMLCWHRLMHAFDEPTLALSASGVRA